MNTIVLQNGFLRTLLVISCTIASSLSFAHSTNQVSNLKWNTYSGCDLQTQSRYTSWQGLCSTQIQEADIIIERPPSIQAPIIPIIQSSKNNSYLYTLIDQIYNQRCQGLPFDSLLAQVEVELSLTNDPALADYLDAALNSSCNGSNQIGENDPPKPP